MTRGRFLVAALAILLVGGLLRTLDLRADPPTGSPGIVWHDEGAWVHNARNKALWGQWTTDRWNPVYIAPVFTALEYGAFRAFGVGTWQARTVPVASGLLAIAMFIAGLSALGGRRTALIGGLVLAVDYTWVMWNRAALMESTMTAFMVVAWAAYARAARRPTWGLVAGIAAVLAMFTKASAAFFPAILAADAVATVALARMPRLRNRMGAIEPTAETIRGAYLVLAGLAISAGIVVAIFVWPHWADYWAYNVQMSLLRKPKYDLRSLIDRASWLPVVLDFFARLWPVLLAAAIGMLGILARWRTAQPAERLLVWWFLGGLAVLTIHDSGNERYYVMFVPALVALASLVVGSGANLMPVALASAPLRSRLLGLPVVLLTFYLLIGTRVRLAFLSQIVAGDFKTTVRLSTAVSIALAAVLLAAWPRIVRWTAARRISPVWAAILVTVVAAVNLSQFVRWYGNHGDLNYKASVALGRVSVLAPGTLVHGKLANGLSLENQIRPIFVGNGFGNYDDRFEREDARYILTYDLPKEGYESQPGLIAEILDRYPNRAVIASFPVDETAGADRAILIDKHPGSPPPAALGLQRARD